MSRRGARDSSGAGALLGGRRRALPPDYDSLNLVNATAQSANCTCDCTDGGPPACDTTSATYHTGIADCALHSGTLALDGGPCTTSGLASTDTKLEVETPNVVGGCGGGTAVPPGLNQPAVRLCVPQCASDESVCNSHPGLQACVYVAKNAGNCPPGYGNGPFYVGASPSALCDNCSCKPMGDCTGMQFHYFTSSTNCTGGDHNVNMDTSCNNVQGGATVVFGSMNIQGSIKNPSCNVSPTFSHVTYGANDYTVCCQ